MIFHDRKIQVFGIATALLLLAYFLFAAAPLGKDGFQTNSIYEIPEDATLSETAENLQTGGYIKNKQLFKLLVVATAPRSGIKAGSYFFGNKQNVFWVSDRIATGDFGVDPVKVTIPEGLNNKEMAEVLESILPDFDKDEFLEVAKEHEGYLFPDTYYFLSTIKPKNIVKEMTENFELKTMEVLPDIEASEYELFDYVRMASILEKEARRYETRQKIASVLWNRIEIDMALQVDAAFLYFLGKTTFDLTLDDLDTDSPYNTYKYPGFPIGPISNPGLDSIKAAIYYDESPNLFYLSDYEGVTHFAENFEIHKLNKEKYLR